MNEQPERQDDQLRRIASTFAYPATPDLAAALRRRLSEERRPAPGRRRARLAWALVLALALGGLLAVPQVRARLQEWLRIGTVQISVSTPTADPAAESPLQPPPTALPGSAQPAGQIPVTATPARPLALLDAGRETTLAEARRTLPFAIPLPSPPADPGPPDHVFLPEPSGHAVVLVWVDPQQTDQISLSLHLLDSEIWAQKMLTAPPESLTVNGAPALWVPAQHEIFLFNPHTGERYATPNLRPGQTLLWSGNGLTYRLETSLSRQDTVRLAESLR